MERLISTPAASPTQTRIRGPLSLPSRLPAAAAWPRLRCRPGAIALASPLRHEALSAAPEEAPSQPPPPAAVGSPWELLGSLLPKVIGFFYSPPFFLSPRIRVQIFRFLSNKIGYCHVPRYVSAGAWLDVGVVQLTVLCRQFMSGMLLFGIRDKEHAECRACLVASISLLASE